MAVGAPLTRDADRHARTRSSRARSAPSTTASTRPSRTLRVQASIHNADDTLRAGMSFQVAMKFPGDTYPAVNPLAIQWGTDGAFVWAIKDGKAKRTPVRIIQRNTETVLVEGDLTQRRPSW